MGCVARGMNQGARPFAAVTLNLQVPICPKLTVSRRCTFGQENVIPYLGEHPPGPDVTLLYKGPPASPGRKGIAVEDFDSDGTLGWYSDDQLNRIATNGKWVGVTPN